MTSGPVPIHDAPHLMPIDTDGRGNVYQVISLPGGVDLIVRAEQIRRAPTGGTHARIVWERGISEGPDEYLIHSYFNVDRDEERVRLINRLYGKLGPLPRASYPKELMQAHFDVFCASIVPALTAGEEGGWIAPASSRAIPDMWCPWVIKGGGCIIFGPPKVGKTWAALTIAVSVQYGLSRLFPVAQGTVLYVNLERSVSAMRQRLLTLGEALDIAGRPLLMLNARGRSLADVEAAMTRMIERHNVGLLVVDSLSRAGVGSLTRDDAMNEAMDLLNRVCAVRGASWLLVGHTPRDKDAVSPEDLGHVYGSMMADAAADALVRLVSEERRTMDGHKLLGLGFVMAIPANDFETPPLYVIGLDFAPREGLVGIYPAQSGEFPVIEGSERLSPRERMVRHLLDVGKDNATHIAEVIGLSRAAATRLLRSDSRIGGPLKQGTEAYYWVKDSPIA